MQQYLQSLCSAAPYEQELLQYLANSTWLWYLPSLLAQFDRLGIVLVSENEIVATRVSCPSCTHNSAMIAEHAMCDSKKSVAVVPPAVAEALKSLHKLRTGPL
jgi:hypothetical protein